MCVRADARSVAAIRAEEVQMASRLIPLVTLAALAATAAPAHAASFVYGGTTSGGSPIAITAAKGAKKLSGAVISWEAQCGDQSMFGDAEQLTPAPRSS